MIRKIAAVAFGSFAMTECELSFGGNKVVMKARKTRGKYNTLRPEDEVVPQAAIRNK